MLDKKNEILDISFDDENSHIALTHESQGFSANNRPEPLIIKGQEKELTEEAKVDLEKVNNSSTEVSEEISEKDSASGDDSELNVEKSDEDSSSKSPEDLTNNKGDEMSEKDLEKANADLQARLDEIEKAAAEKDAIINKMVEKEAEAVKAAYGELVKSLSFVEEGSQEELVEAIIKANSKVLVSVLEEAQEIIEKGVTEEVGFDADTKKSSEDTSLAEMIKAKYSKEV